MLTHRYRYDWVDFPVDPPDATEENWNPDFAGFRARIMANPLKRDVDDERRARQARDEIKTEVAEAEYLQLIAPRVVAWEFETEDITGAIVAVPPPADSWEAFHVLPPALYWWLTSIVPAMHLPKLKAIWLGDAGITGTTTQTDRTLDPELLTS